jgi:hypothetical protein
MIMQRMIFIAATLLATACATASTSSVKDELTETRALFDANIRAIQEKNREAYLACYRDDAALIRSGPEGVKLGYEELATGTATTGSDQWPESLEAKDVEVHSVQPGVVYGAYKYRVVIKGVATEGLSERVFIKYKGAWKIAVSTAFAKAP